MQTKSAEHRSCCATLLSNPSFTPRPVQYVLVCSYRVVETKNFCRFVAIDFFEKMFFSLFYFQEGGPHLKESSLRFSELELG